MSHSDKTSDPLFRFLDVLSYSSLILITTLYAFLEGNTHLQWLGLALAISVVAISRAVPGILGRGFRLSHPLLAFSLSATVVFAYFQSVAIPFVGTTISLDPYETKVVVLVLGALIFYFEAVTTLARSLKGTRALAALVIVIGLASSVFGVVQFYVVPPTTITESFAQYANRNHFLLIVEMALGLIAGIVLRVGVATLWRWLALFIGGVLLYAAILVGSRGGLLSIAAMLVIGVFLNFTRDWGPSSRSRLGSGVKATNQIFRKVMVPLGVALAILSGIVILTVIVGGERTVSRFENLNRETRSSPDRLNRAAIWKATGELIKDNPVFGVGFGAYSVAIARYDRSDGTYPIEQAHNDYLEILASGGIVGGLLLLMFLFLLTKSTASAIRSADSQSAPYRLGAAIGLCGVAMHSFVDFGLHIAINVLCTAVLIAIAVGPSPEGTRRTTGRPKASRFGNVKGKRLGRLAAIAYASTALTIAFVACVNGIATYYASESQRVGELSFADYAVLLDASNPRAHISRAEALASVGDFDAASTALTVAIELREQDPFLWLRLGQMRNRSTNPEAAASAFVRSSELAPGYYQPWAELGEIAVARGDIELGFSFFRQAAKRNREFLFDMIELAEKTFPDDPAMIESLLPSDAAAKKVIANHFVTKKWITPNVMTFLTGDEISQDERAEYVTRLIEMGEFAKAYAIWTVLNEQTMELAEANVVNGGFENGDLTEIRSFGWQADDDSVGAAISRIGTGAHSGSHALRVRFQGNADGSGLLSNLVYLRPQTNYEISFAFRTEGLVSAGLPTIQLIDAGTMSSLIGTVIINTEKPEWIMIRRRFLSGKTPAAYIRFGREACAMSPCPIFGDVYLDSFEIREF